MWLATSVLADGKFIALFAMLLGPSIVMLPSCAGDRAMPMWRVHVRRMATLLVLSLEKLSAMAEAMQGALLLRPHALRSIYADD